MEKYGSNLRCYPELMSRYGPIIEGCVALTRRLPLVALLNTGVAGCETLSTAANVTLTDYSESPPQPSPSYTVPSLALALRVRFPMLATVCP